MKLKYIFLMSLIIIGFSLYFASARDKVITERELYDIILNEIEKEEVGAGGFWYLSGGAVRPSVSSWDLKIPDLANCDTIDTDANGLLSCGSDDGAIAQLGQIGDVSTSTLATGYTLHYDGSNWNASSTLFINAATGSVSIGTTTSCQKLCVDGSIRTTDTFYGNTWTSYDGDSMNIKPSGDEDDFLSFKTVANRATIKVEGDSKIYVQSSDSDEVGIEYYKDASHSGGVIYYKNEELFGLTSQDSMVFKVCGDYDDYVKICSANNIPELSVASSSAFKINAGGTNSLLLNHDGGNVGIGTANPSKKLDIALGTMENNVNEGLLLSGNASDFVVYLGMAMDLDNTSDNAYGFVRMARTPATVYLGLEIGSDSRDGIRFLTGDNAGDGTATERMRIDESGNIGIGTTSPLSKFSMNSGTNGFRIDSSGIVQQGTWQGTALTDAYVSNTLTVDGYLSDTGDIGTGVYDFGGADSFEIPNNTNLTIDANGEVYVNTTSASSSLRYYDGTAERALYPISEKTITIASSTLNSYKGQTASSTIPLGVASIHGETWTEISCYTDAGTVEVEFGDGTNWIDYQTLSTALTTDSSLSNNTFTRYEKRYIRIGQASSLGTLSCVVSIRKNAD